MLHAIQDLRAIAESCQKGSPLDSKLATWLGNSLERFLTHRTASLEEALGLRRARGGVPWWREEAMRRRDSLLRELAGRHFAGQSVCTTARQIRLLALRYAASAWRIDQAQDAMPQHYRDTPKEYIWRIFKAGAPMPIGERHLRTILANVRKAPIIGSVSRMDLQRVGT